MKNYRLYEDKALKDFSQREKLRCESFGSRPLGQRGKDKKMKNVNIDMENVQINVNYIISELTKHITNTAKDLEYLQKASTNVTLSSACATNFVTSLTKLIARINECKEV